MIEIIRAGAGDAEVLAGLAARLWPGNDDAACFIAYADGIPAAFAQCQMRHDYVEGTESSPVGYLEGVFVAEAYRRKGYGAALLAKCEKWAKEKGCAEFASDCELDNTESQAFHQATGFDEANRIVAYVRKI